MFYLNLVDYPMLFLLLSKLGLVGGVVAHKILVTLGLDFGLGIIISVILIMQVFNTIS